MYIPEAYFKVWKGFCAGDAIIKLIKSRSDKSLLEEINNLRYYFEAHNSVSSFKLLIACGRELLSRYPGLDAEKILMYLALSKEE